MAEVIGFKGWRYNGEKIKDLETVFAPPYDVISPKDQDGFYKKNPHNVIRLILGKANKNDTVKNNKYTRAKQFLYDWVNKEFLIQDESPAIYIVVQDYRQGNQLETRLGFMAAMHLGDKSVLRHENTLASPKKDRLALLKQVRTNLSPIFGLFEDKEASVQRILKKCIRNVNPQIDVTIDGVRHRLFVELRQEFIEQIKKTMATKPMLIADGHHRFEVALKYKKWVGGRRKAEGGREEPWNYVMTYFADAHHNPFKIYPTHRLIRLKKGEDPIKVLEKRGSLKKVATLSAVSKMLSKNRMESTSKIYPFGIYTKKNGFMIFSLGEPFLPKDKKNIVNLLDVSVLHQSILEPCFKIKAIEKSNAIDFTRDAKEACEKVKKGEWDMAIFLRPTSLKEMITVSKKGLKMPQKSTYFYPKLLSGLVFHRLDEIVP